jgi:hypothetical protein
MERIGRTNRVWLALTLAAGCGGPGAVPADPTENSDRADTRDLPDPYLAVAGAYSDPVSNDRSIGVERLYLGGAPDRFNAAELWLYPAGAMADVTGIFTLAPGRIDFQPAAVTTVCSLPTDCRYGYTCSEGICTSKGTVSIAFTASANGLQVTVPGLASQFLQRGHDADYFAGGAFAHTSGDGELERVWFAVPYELGKNELTYDPNADDPQVGSGTRCSVTGGSNYAIMRATASWSDGGGDDEVDFTIGQGVLDLWGSLTGRAACGHYSDLKVADHRYVGFTLEGQGSFELFAKLVDDHGTKVWHDATSGAAIPFCQKAGDTQCAPPLASGQHY